MNKGWIIFKRIRRTKKRWARTLSKRRSIVAAAGLVVAALLVISSGAFYNRYMTASIDPTRYTPLLNTIAKGESRGNYNAYFGHTTNDSIRFTDMSVEDVLKWQQAYVAQGHASSAVGKYQIVRPTLAGLIHQLAIDPNVKFDEKLQDRLAVALLEKRGAAAYMNDKLSRQQFAANLAQEWAALPKTTGTDPSQSYYAGDGLNKVQISIDEVYKALAIIKN